MISRLKIIFAFLRLRRMFSPRPQFRAALWKRLEQEMAPTKTSWWKMHRLAAASLVAVFVFLMCGGTATYAYTNPDVVPDTLLYPVKRTVEQVEETLSLTPAAKARAQTHRLTHRLAEAERVVDKEKKFEKVMNEVDEEFLAASTKTIPEKKSERLMQTLKRADEKTMKDLEQLVEKNPTRAFPGIQRILTSDTKRIENRLSTIHDAQAQSFLEQRLKRRKEMLEKISINIERQSAPSTSGTSTKQFERSRTQEVQEPVQPRTR